MSGEVDFVFHQPDGCMAVNYGTYVHGVGFSLRSVALPFVTSEAVFEYMGEGRCSHSIPAMWLFTGYWPEREKDKLWSHFTFDVHEVTEVLADPRKIRLFGAADEAPLVSVDPITKDARLSVAEFNGWVSNDFEVQTMFTDMSVDFGQFEELLSNSIQEDDNDNS